MMRRSILFICLLGFLVGCEKETQTSLPGYVEGDYVYLSSPVAGFLKQLHVSEGDSVHQNQLLIELDNEEMTAAARQSEAEFNKASANLADLQKGKRHDEIQALDAQIHAAEAAFKLSQQELSRQQQLRNKGFSNQASLDQATSSQKQAHGHLEDLQAQRRLATQAARSDQVIAAEASVASTQAAAQQTGWKAKQLQIVSPAAGSIESVIYHQGEWVPANTPVLSLLSPTNIKVRFYLPEPLLSKIHLKQSVLINCDSCQTAIPAQIRFIANASEYTPPIIYSQENRSKLVYRIEAYPVQPEQFPLHPGQPVSIQLP